MKILITFLTFGRNIFGGIEHATFNLAIGLKNVGAQVFIYTGMAYSESSKDEGIEIYASPFLQSKFSGNDVDIFTFYSINKNDIRNDFENYYSAINPDLVISVDHLWGILPVLNIQLKCKKILWMHVKHNQDLLKRALNSDYEIFAVSKFLANSLQKYTTKDIKILPNTIVYRDFDIEWKPSRKFFCNARISPEKNVKDAVLAFIEFSKQISGYELLLCKGSYPFGNYPELLEEIKTLVKLNSHLRFDFYNNVKWVNIPKILSKSTAIILPSGAETFGIAALEAMAMGVPLITTNVGNLPELTQGCCSIVPVGDINAVSQCMIKAVKSLSGSIESKRIAKEYDFERIAFNLINYT